MRYVVLYNPIAGRGKAKHAAALIAEALVDHGHVVERIATVRGAEHRELDDVLAKSAAGLIVAGGDGTIRQAAAFAIRHDAPIYQFPFGTENLFAREFGMNRRIATLLRALEHEPVAVDVGDVNGQVFLMMVSIGIDAEVIHDLMTHRSTAITHLSYAAPIVRQLLRWKPASMHIDVDGSRVEVSGPGMLVVANSRQYAFRFDPVPVASMTDGLLDLVFMPVRSRIGIAALALRTRIRRHLSARGVVHASGTRVRVECAEPQRYQVDGDAALDFDCEEGEASPKACFTPLEISVRPGALRVLKP